MDNISRDVFAKHFEKLSNIPDESIIAADIASEVFIQNEILDATISQEEVVNYSRTTCKQANIMSCTS